jgi:hypothetical protein
VAMPSICNIVYVGYPATLIVPFNLKHYYCEVNNGILVKEDNGNLLLTAKHKGQVKILVHKKSDNQIADSIFLRAFELPMPVAVITGKCYGKISKKILLQQNTFYFQWENVINNIENVSTKIVDSFNVLIIRDDRVICNEKCKGFEFTNKVKIKLRHLRASDLFIVNKIYGRFNSSEVEFNPIILEVLD